LAILTVKVTVVLETIVNRQSKSLSRNIIVLRRAEWCFI